MADRRASYAQGSLSLLATVAMGTGVMIGAGIFALTGQVAELAGGLFPVAFIIAAIISAFSAYSYIKVASAYPSSGGIAMILQKAYGPSTMTGAASLLMALSMVINESLVARTFGAYTLRLVPGGVPGVWVPVLAVGLIVMAFVVNIAGNQVIGTVSNVSAVLKIGGLLVFAAIAVAASGVDLQIRPWPAAGDPSVPSFVGAIALAILAFKGFTTITNSGDEVVDPVRNIGRAGGHLLSLHGHRDSLGGAAAPPRGSRGQGAGAGDRHRPGCGGADGLLGGEGQSRSCHRGRDPGWRRGGLWLRAPVSPTLAAQRIEPRWGRRRPRGAARDLRR